MNRAQIDVDKRVIRSQRIRFLEVSARNIFGMPWNKIKFDTILYIVLNKLLFFESLCSFCILISKKKGSKWNSNSQEKSSKALMVDEIVQ